MSSLKLAVIKFNMNIILAPTVSSLDTPFTEEEKAGNMKAVHAGAGIPITDQLTIAQASGDLQRSFAPFPERHICRLCFSLVPESWTPYSCL